MCSPFSMHMPSPMLSSGVYLCFISKLYKFPGYLQPGEQQAAAAHPEQSPEPVCKGRSFASITCFLSPHCPADSLLPLSKGPMQLLLGSLLLLDLASFLLSLSFVSLSPALINIPQNHWTSIVKYFPHEVKNPHIPDCCQGRPASVLVPFQ